MLRRLLSAMVAVVACMVATAQGICVINGTIADCKLNDGKKVKSVTLTRTDESGREIEVAKAKVKWAKWMIIPFVFALMSGTIVYLLLDMFSLSNLAFSVIFAIITALIYLFAVVKSGCLSIEDLR